jgi:DNA-binding transcriptional regulator YiaG
MSESDSTLNRLESHARRDCILDFPLKAAHPTSFSSFVSGTVKLVLAVLGFALRSAESGVHLGQSETWQESPEVEGLFGFLSPDDDWERSTKINQLRPERTHMCFDSEEVGKILRLRKGVGKTAAILGAPINDAPPETVTELRKHLDLTQVDVAESLAVTPRTVQNWESRRAVASRRFRDLKELRDLLARYIEDKEVSGGMDSPSEAFENHTPRQLMREGKTRDLILEFRRMQSGEPL